MAVARTLDWERDGRDWPFREASRFVEAAGLRWHVQDLGEGPPLLLLHGTGSATHSWRGLVPLLRSHFRLVAVDLPGHGFTAPPPQRLFTLPGMADGLCAVLDELRVAPAMIAAHSAGAAVMLRMALGGRVAPRALVSINGALKPYRGEAARWLSPLAKVLFLNPFTPRLFAWRAGDRASVERLVRNTGSMIDAAGIDLYRTLVSSPGHVEAALGMMANWDLQPLARDLRRLTIPLLLVAGSNDRTIKAEDAFATRDAVAGARVEILRGLGHLAHEEAPERLAELILGFAREHGIIG